MPEGCVSRETGDTVPEGCGTETGYTMPEGCVSRETGDSVLEGCSTATLLTLCLRAVAQRDW